MINKELLRKNIIPVIIGLVCIFVVYILSSVTFINNFENFLIDARFQWKAHLSRDHLISQESVQQGTAIKVGKKVQSPIMIFGIDEGSLNELGRWPWPRSVHKKFLDFFFAPPDFKYRPYIVFYDIFFDKYGSLLLKKQNVSAMKQFIDTNINQDKIGNLKPEVHIKKNELKKINPKNLIVDIKQLLKNTIDDPIFFNKLKEIKEYNEKVNQVEKNRGGFLVFDFLASTKVTGLFAPEIVAERIKYMKDYYLNVKNPEDFKIKIHRDLKFPVPEIMKYSAGSGSAMIYLDSDGVVRKMPLIVKFYDKRMYKANDGSKKPIMAKPRFVATIDMIIAMKYYNVKAKDVEVVFGKHIKFKNARVPIFEQDVQKIEGFDPIPKGWKVKKYTTKDVTVPIDYTGQMRINFQGQHQSFDNQPYFEGVQMQRMKNYDNRINYKNRIILNGFYSSAGLGEGRDYFTTPYKILYGIEIHANALYTIFNEEFIYPINTGVNALIYFFLLVAFVIVLPRVKIWKAFLMFIVTEFAIFFAGMIIFNHFYVLINMVLLMAFSMILFLAIIVYRVLTEEKEKRQIKGMFSQYVNPEVVTELMDDPDKLQLGGEDRELTVMFSDIRGFTTISENLKPQELVTLLNAYLSDMTNLLFEYRGTLDKYIGDAVMAFWGAPVPIKNHAALAADSCLRMMEKVHELNEELQNNPEYAVFKEKNLKIDIGIGLNSGVMTVGNMGSEVRKNYTIMGDSVNLGARLEGVNKVYTTNIIISEFTYELVKEWFVVRELDLIRVKGKHKPVRIYELIGRKDGVESDMIKALD